MNNTLKTKLVKENIKEIEKWYKENLNILKKFRIKNISKELTSKQEFNIYPAQCFNKSIEYFEEHCELDNYNMSICVGLYANTKNSHYWVEIDENTIFDGNFQMFFDKKKYYEFYKIKVIKKVEKNEYFMDFQSLEDFCTFEYFEYYVTEYRKILKDINQEKI